MAGRKKNDDQLKLDGSWKPCQKRSIKIVASSQLELHIHTYATTHAYKM